jgi:NAD dependent epimerase/dehydratase
MQDKFSFWQKKQVLVTGAGGFIGSHLTEMLIESGAKVRAFVRYNSRADPGLLSYLPKDKLSKLEIVAGDLRDLPAILAVTKDVDIIFHLGALIAIPYSYLHPAEVIESNVLGTMNVLLAGKENKVGRIIHTSTSEVYGSALRVPIDESHPLQGQSPYSASKISADKIVESFYYAYDQPVVTIRPFNTYGPRQSARAVIPSIIIQALNQNTIHLGNLNAIRDFTFVSDTVEGFLCSAQVAGIEGKTINLGVGSEIKIGDLARDIISIIGKEVDIEVEEKRLRPVKSEVNRLLSDNSLARQLLGWQPHVCLLDGLSKTIKWISDNIQYYNSSQYQV